MWRRSLIVVVAVLCGGSMAAAAQQAHPPESAQESRPTHGIIRKPQSKPSSEAAKPTATEHTKPAPAASTEAVAAAIANAVRSLEEKENTKAEPASPQVARSSRRAAPRAVPRRRYQVKWPSQRFEVQWPVPDDRILLSWGAQEASAEYAHDEQRLEP